MKRLRSFGEKFAFQLLEDRALSAGMRWVVVAPDGPVSLRLLLARASTPQQIRATDNFWTDYRAMQSRGVKFRKTAREESYGTVAVFEDLYGSKWDLLMPSGASGSG